MQFAENSSAARILDLPKSNSNLTPAGSAPSFSFPTTEPNVTAEALLKDLKVSFTIGEDDEVSGTIRTKEGASIVIRGVVKGNIECKGCVVLIKGGRIEGTVTAAQAWIEGDIDSADGKTSVLDVGELHIGKGARVIADCSYDNLSIATPNRGVRGRLECRQTGDSNA